MSLSQSEHAGRELRSPGKFQFDPERFFSACDEVERLAVSDPENAIRDGEALVEQADFASNDTARVRSRRALAQANAYAGHFETALQQCADAIHIGVPANLAVETARARLASLHALSSLGRFSEAIEAGLAARASFVELGDRELTARADLNLGAVYAMSDDPVSALAYLDRSRPAFVDQTAILAQLDTNRGNALAAIDDYTGAEDAFATAVASFELSEQHLAAAIAEGNRGYLDARRGLIQDAMAHFERARRMLLHSGARSHRARLIAEQADVIATMGMATEAIKSLELAIPELDETAQRIEAARARVTLATADITLGRNDDALIALTTAIDVFSDAAQTVDLGRAQLTAAGLALHHNNLERAETLSDHAALHLSDRPADAARAALTRANVQLRKPDAAAALRAIEYANEIADRLELTPVAAEAHLLKGRWLRMHGQSALREFSLAVELTEQIRGTLQAGIFRSAFQSDRIAPYTELLAEAVSGTACNETVAFEASELIKSRALLDVIHGSQDSSAATGTESDPYVRKIDSLRQRVNWQYSRLNERTETGASHGSIRALEQEIQTLETQIAAASTSAGSRLKPVELPRAQEMLAEGTVAISYNFLGEELTAIMVSNRECTVHRSLATRTEIEESMRRFRLQVSRAHARGREGEMPPRLVEAAQRELLQLWKLLVEPIASQMQDVTDLILVPGGPLHGVPFAALWDGANYLIEKQSISVVPSLSIYTRLSEQSRSEVDERMVIVGVADSDAPDIRQEVLQIAEITKTDLLLLDSDATADRVLESITGATSLHVACHGRFSKEFPEASGLKCVDRWLTMAEIAGSELNHSHITLSACDTGRASIQAVEELIGLSSGFYAAGARSMILTLWPVDDRRTASLMSDFYGEHMSGISFAASLRQAQLNVINSGQHPAYWAPFIFGGRA